MRTQCGQEGHIGPACKTPRCDRCAVFGHPTAGCTEPCQRCGHAHATVDCTQRKTYAAVTQSTATRPSRVQPQQTASAPAVPPASEQPKNDPSPPVCPQDGPPLQGNLVAAHDSQLSEAGSLSSDADRLVVAEDDEVTHGQGHPPSSPASRVPATPGALERLGAKAASAGTPAGTPAGASSAVDMMRQEAQTRRAPLQPRRSVRCTKTARGTPIWRATIGTTLVAVFNAFLRGGGVPDSFRRGRIVLLPKEGGDHSTPNAWRPITLLNTDYKILAAVLVRRLRDILPGLVSPYQTCSVPGRTIFSSLSLTRDVFQYATSRGLRGAFVSLDQEKAFDRLEHHFLFSILRAYGFPADFVRLFEVLYADLVSGLVINGRVTPCFSVARGVRQGCPLSPLLFVLCLDPLLRRINDHPSVRGFPLPGSGSLKVSAYADDISLFVRDSDSLIVIFRLYEDYAALSGARLNTSKSKALIFGGFSDPLPGGIPTTAVVRVLGVLFDCSGVSPDTWAGIVADVTHRAGLAARFSLPLRDRAYIVKSVLCAKLWFVARVARPPPTIVRRLNSVIFSYFWEQRTELVVRQALRLPRTSGGWGLPCLATFSRILALRGVLELLEAPDYPGRSLVLYWLGTHRRILVPRGLGNLCPTAEVPSPFYVAAARTHQQLTTDAPDADVLDTPASRLCEALCAPEVPLLHQVRSRTSDWASALSPDLPTAVADFHWRLGWGVLPTRDRLTQWGVSASNLCPNCGALETNVHVVFDCVVARTFWTLVSRMFALPLGRHFRARHRSSRLVFAAACFILWQNRNTAVAQGRRLGRMFPMIRRLRNLLLCHLEDALFVLGEKEFLRRWHADFIAIRSHRPVLGGALPL
ncbi:hypothetical protein ISCGN_003475 [Ixodes scapularis]